MFGPLWHVRPWARYGDDLLAQRSGGALGRDTTALRILCYATWLYC
jgi:hypothetical protein